MLPVQTWLLQLAIAIVISTFFLWKYSVRKFEYWKKQGIHFVNPYPFVGNFLDIIRFKKCMNDWISDLYFSTDEKLFGVFIFDEPGLVVKDSKIVQLVMIKDSDHFIDRTNVEPHDEVMKNFMFFQKSPEWKKDRAKLHSMFTPAKLKGMYYLVNNIGEEMVRYLEIHLGRIDAKDISAKYSTNVIAKCAFGIDAYCFDEKESEFRKFGKRMFDFSFRNGIAQMSYFFKHDLVRTFQIDFFHRNVKDYFCRAFTETMASRRTKNTKVNDFVDLLIELKNSENLSEESGTKRACGQAIMFFVAGFETTSSTIAFTLHEFCLNEDIQNKARAEIHKIIEEHGAITYEAIQEMKYLKNCISETLRKYPVIAFLDRQCHADYAVPGTDIVIEKGMRVYIPVAGLHLDEKYFSEPRRYNPDRFMDKNYNENGLYYMPFGDGPRKCFGDRFGLMSTQLALIHILSKFEVERCAETPDPVEFGPKSMINQSKVGLPMRIKRITSSRDP